MKVNNSTEWIDDQLKGLTAYKVEYEKRVIEKAQQIVNAEMIKKLIAKHDPDTKVDLEHPKEKPQTLEIGGVKFTYTYTQSKDAWMMFRVEFKKSKT